MARILVLSPYEPPSDGIARHSAHLVEAWDSAGHTVLVIAPGTRRGSDGATVIGSRSTVARIMRKIPRRNIWNDAIAFAPDIVFVQFSIATFNVDLWSVKYLSQKFSAEDIPVVVAFHEAAREFDLLGPVSHRIYRAMARATDVPIVFSSAGRQSLLDHDLFDDVVEVPHGTTGLAHVAESDCSRVKALYQVTKPLVLSLGFTDSDKGTDILLVAADAIAKGVDNNVQFLVAGSPRRRRGVFRIMERRDIRFRRRLRRQADKLTNVEIDFCDYVADNDVAALLRVAEVVVLPYRRTTQSGVGNLALSSRSVLVSSNLPGLKSDLGTAALYVKVGDAVAMAEQVIGLIGDDHHTVREQLRERAGKRAESNTFEKTAEMILSAGLAHRDLHAPE